MKLKYSFLLKFIFIFISGIWFYTPQILATEDKEIKSYSVLEKCNNNWENLTKSLTKDVADYGNRIIQSSRIYPNLDNFLPTYIVTASIPDTQSLPLNNFASEDFYMSENQETKQLFFYHFGKTIF